MKKRILTVLLAVCLVFALGTVALAADGESTTKLPAADGGVITLKGDVEIEITELSTELKSQLSASINNKLEIDLAGHTLTIINPDKGKFGVQIEQNADITIRNGKIVAQQQLGGGHSLFAPKSDVSFTLDYVTLTTNGTGIYAAGSATAVNVNNSTINAGGYAIGTNATADESGKPIYSFNVDINVSKSTLNAPIGALINVPGSLDISDSKINAQYQGVIARGGSTTIDNTAISLSRVNDADEYKKYESKDWEDGNAVPMGGIVVGNRSNAYNYPSRCTVSGSTSVTVPEGTNAVYAYQMADTTNRKVDLAIKNGIFNADVVIAGDGVTPGVSISGGKFTNKDNLGGYLDDGYTFDENGNVEISDDAVAQVGDTVYTDLQDAIDAAITAKKPVQILKNFTITVPDGTAVKTGAVNINGDVTINGNGYTITADTNSFTFEKEKLGNFHVINIQNGADVTITNLKIDGNKCARSGINVYSANGSVNASATLTGVTVRNCTAYGVVAASSTVTVNSITTSGNGWGGINVDSSYANASLTVKDAAITDTYSVVVEGDANNNVVDLKNGSYNNIQVKTSNSDVTIVNGSYYDIVGGDGYVPTRSDVVVKGGTFDNSVEKFADSKLIYEVRVGGEYTYYTNASDAIAAAGPSGDVDYIGDYTGYTHTVTFVYDKNTKTSIDVVNRDEIELPGGKFGGKVITGWTRGSVTYDVGDEVRVTDDMTFYVVLKDGEFDIVIDSKIEHGDISTNVNSADKGDTVYIYVDPDTGYVLDDIDVYYGLNYRYSVKVSYVRNNTYRFEMPNADVYITATFKANGMPFVDVHRTQWFYDSIYYVWSNDMMEGDSATTFNPDGTMTRAMFWAVLGRMDGQTITGTNWVEQARNWAMREGVSDGTNPNDYVTREQMVTMLWRYAGEKNGSANLNRYTDSGSVSGYAVEAMRWAIGNGVIQGVTSTTLAPKANATRAECATIFMRFDKM